MKLSTKGRYGLRAMMELAKSEPGEPVLGRDLACAQDIPLDYLEQILVKLRRAGLIRTTRGAGGGYHLARKADKITALEIVEAVEGSLLPVECLRRKDVCDRNGTCAAQEIWQAAGEAFRDILCNRTLADLRGRQDKLDG